MYSLPRSIKSTNRNLLRLVKRYKPDQLKACKEVLATEKKIKKLQNPELTREFEETKQALFYKILSGGVDLNLMG